MFQELSLYYDYRHGEESKKWTNTLGALRDDLYLWISDQSVDRRQYLYDVLTFSLLHLF